MIFRLHLLIKQERGLYMTSHRNTASASPCRAFNVGSFGRVTIGGYGAARDPHQSYSVRSALCRCGLTFQDLCGTICNIISRKQDDNLNHVKCTRYDGFVLPTNRNAQLDAPRQTLSESNDPRAVQS